MRKSFKQILALFLCASMVLAPGGGVALALPSSGTDVILSTNFAGRDEDSGAATLLSGDLTIIDLNTASNRYTVLGDVIGGSYSLTLASDSADNLIFGSSRTVTLGSLTVSDNSATQHSTITIQSKLQADSITLGTPGDSAYGGHLVFDGGTLGTNNNGIYIYTGTISISEGSSLNFATNANHELDGTISNNGSLIKSGSGVLYVNRAIIGTGSLSVSDGSLALLAANNYSGGTFVSGDNTSLNVFAEGALQGDLTQDGGRVELNFSPTILSSLQGAGGSIGLGSTTLTVNQAGDTSYAGVIYGDGGFAKNGNGTLTLTGGNEIGDRVRVDGGTNGTGTLVTGDGGYLGTGNVIVELFNGGTISIGGADQSINASGTGNVAVTNGATLTLAGANSYSGNTTAGAGSSIKVTGSLGSVDGFGSYIYSGAISIADGATLDFAADDAAQPQQKLDGTISNNGSLIKSGSGVLDVNRAITGTGSLSVSDGSLALLAANNYSGGTFVSGTGSLNVLEEGALQGDLTQDGGEIALHFSPTILSSLQGSGGELDLMGTTLTVDQATDTSYGGKIYSHDVFAKKGNGTLTLTGGNEFYGPITVDGGTDGTGTLATSGTGRLGVNQEVELAGNGTISIGGADQSLTVNGTGNVAVTNGANLTLTGTSNYSGKTSVGAGSSLEVTGGLGSGNATDGYEYTGDIEVADNGSLTFNNDSGADQTLGSATGQITLGDGALLVMDGEDNSLTINSLISGGGGLSISAGEVVLNNSANSYSGGTTVESGASLTIGADGAIGDGPLNILDGGKVTLGDFDLALTGLTGGPTSIMTIAAGRTLTVDIAAGQSDEYLGTLNGGGSLALTGGGDLTLSGTNEYTGNTLISGGSKLILGSASSLGSGNYTGAIAMADGSGIVYNSTTNQTLGGQISGAGSVTVNDGSLTLADAANNYSGGTFVNGGSLNAGASGALQGDLTQSGGTVNLNGHDTTLGNLSGTGGDLNLGSASLTVDQKQNIDLSYAGNINGSGNLVKGGVGTLLLTGNNTYSGDTTISGGDLGIVGSGVLGGGSYSGNINIAANAGFVYYSSASQDLDGQISGGGMFTVADGTLTLSGANSYTGGTAVVGGTLLAGSNDALTGDFVVIGGTLDINGQTASIGNLLGADDGSGSGNVDLNGGSLAINQTASTAYDGIFTGSAGDTLIINQPGDSTLTLSGDSSASLTGGDVTLNAGSLTLDNLGALGFANLAMTSASTLNLNEDGGSLNNAISGSGDLVVTPDLAGGVTLNSDSSAFGGITTIGNNSFLAFGPGGKLGGSLTLMDGSTLNNASNPTGGYDMTGGGQTLNVIGHGTIDGDLLADNSTLNLVSDGTTGDGAILAITGDSSITNSEINVGFTGDADVAVGTKIELLDVDGASDLTGTKQGDGTALDALADSRAGQMDANIGASRKAEIQLIFNADGSVSAVVGRTRAAEESKALSQGVLGTVALTAQGQDLVAEQGVSAAIKALDAASAAQTNGAGWTGFTALSAGSLRYDTGSHVDVNSVNALVGAAIGAELSAGRLAGGAFFEYGNGSYDTTNDFTAATVKGDGNTNYVGGGLLARMDFADSGPGHVYAEASARLGNLDNDYSSDLRDPITGSLIDYDASSAYYGAHLGLGYDWNLTGKTNLDLYARYLWTHVEGDSVTLSDGTDYKFDDVDSQRVRLGARAAYQLNDYVSPYLGAAWEYEFDAKAQATVGGDAVAVPELGGSTGIGEFGLRFQPSLETPLTFDLGVQGYTGRREGVTGSLQIKFEF